MPPGERAELLFHVEAAEKAIEVSRRTGRSWDLSNALGAAILAWPLHGRFDRMEEHAAETDRLAEREGDAGTRLPREGTEPDGCA